MTKNEDSYRLSRHNAQRHGCFVKGPITCRGEACPYRDVCSLVRAGSPCPTGELCPTEVEYAREFEASFRRRYGAVAPYLDAGEFDQLVEQAVVNALQRDRASSRWNRAWLQDGGVTGENGQREFALGYRYSVGLGQQLSRIMERIQIGAERLSQHGERIDTLRRPVGLTASQRPRVRSD
jgi:hypothetical protein